MRMLRRLRSSRPRTSASVMPPFTASAATEVQIIQLSTTATGERKRSKAAYPSQSESRTRTKALVNAASVPARRSEEHTSELQSHHDLVCRLLLEKKNR